MRARARCGTAIAGAVVLALSIGCSSGKPLPVAVRNPLADSADQVLYHTKSVLTDGGVMKAEVYGDTAYVFDDNTRVEMRGVRTVFFTVTGAKNAVLTSRQGTYNTRTNNMEARGDVVVVSEDGRHLTTPILRYFQSRNEISSDTSFTLTDSAHQMIGIGFTSDPDMNNMHCMRACSGSAGTVTLPGGPGDTARSGAPVRPPSGRGRPLPPSSGGAPPSSGGAAAAPGASVHAAARGRATGAAAPRGMPGAASSVVPTPAVPQPQASPPAAPPTP
jgi:LPS export ABC transporter protein LptC